MLLAAAAEEEELEEAEAVEVPLAEESEPEDPVEPEEPDSEEPVWLAPFEPVALPAVTTEAPDGIPPTTTVVELPTETSKLVSEREMFWTM